MHRRTSLLHVASIAASLTVPSWTAHAAARPQRAGETSAAPARDETTALKVYDLRALAIIPMEPRRGSLANVDSWPPGSGQEERGPFDAPARRAPEVGPASGADTLVALVTNSMGLTPNKIAEGLYAVVATEGDHRLLADLFAQVRAVDAPTYEVEIALLQAPSAAAPAIGAPAPTDGGAPPMLRSRQIAVRHLATDINSLRRQHFVADWQPIVAEQTVGFDPVTAFVDDGVRLSVHIGAPPTLPESGGSGSPGTIPVKLAGEVSYTRINDAELPVAGTNTGSQPPVLRFGQPVSLVRSVRSELKLQPGTPTVVAVLDGFEPGQAIVVTMSIRPMR